MWERPLYYDIDGNPISYERASELFGQKWGDRESGDLGMEEPLPWWRIGFDVLAPFHVSTVWLGLDHQHGAGPPLIFETMVFTEGDRDKRDWLDSFTRRYSTKQAARAGHESVVLEVRAHLAQMQLMDEWLDKKASAPAEDDDG